jgi:K+-sensing histidine kinase KdpD
MGKGGKYNLLSHYDPNISYRIMVCITPQKSCERLIEHGARRAEETGGEFCAVYVNKSDYISKDLQQHKILEELFEKAKAAGGRVTILVGQKIHKALANFAEENGVKEIFMGKSLRSAFEIARTGEVINPLINQVEKNNITVNVIS